jgi:hypothetical protein
MISAACSASNIVTKFFGSGGSIESRIEDVEEELNPEGCFTTEEQFAEYWEGTKMMELVFEGKTCATGNLAVYKNCLSGKVLQEGMCIEEAEMACSPEYAALPELFGGESARIPLFPIHSEAEDPVGFLEVSALGNGEGVLMYGLSDKHLCTIDIEVDFRGALVDDGCSLSGQANMTFLYQGSACAGVCSSGPNSNPCPVTRSGESTWQASVNWDDGAKKWIISGGAGCDDESSPGCVGFRGEY